MKVIFDGERPLPYHDFDSGDCYLLLAKVYIMLGEKAKAMKCVRESDEYYAGMFGEAGETEKVGVKAESPFVSGSSIDPRLDRGVVKKKLERKLDSGLIEELRAEAGFDEIRSMVARF